jgi:hypothetical protein
MKGYLRPRRSRCDTCFRVAGSLAAGVLFHGWYPPSKARVCPQVIKSFDEMGLRDDLLRGIFSYGFEKPSAIQQRTGAVRNGKKLPDRHVHRTEGGHQAARVSGGLAGVPTCQGQLTAAAAHRVLWHAAAGAHDAWGLGVLRKGNTLHVAVTYY